MLTYCWNTKNLVEYQNYAFLGVVVNSFKDAELSHVRERPHLYFIFKNHYVSEITSKNHEKKESS